MQDNLSRGVNRETQKSTKMRIRPSVSFAYLPPEPHLTLKEQYAFLLLSTKNDLGEIFDGKIA